MLGGSARASRSASQPLPMTGDAFTRVVPLSELVEAHLREQRLQAGKPKESRRPAFRERLRRMTSSAEQAMTAAAQRTRSIMTYKRKDAVTEIVKDDNWTDVRDVDLDPPQPEPVRRSNRTLPVPPGTSSTSIALHTGGLQIKGSLGESRGASSSWQVPAMAVSPSEQLHPESPEELEECSQDKSDWDYWVLFDETPPHNRSLVDPDHADTSDSLAEFLPKFGRVFDDPVQ